MSARIEWSGLDELAQMLTHAPRHIRTEGMAVVKEETEAAAMEIALAYSRRTGRLKRGVRTQFPSTTILYGQVISSAPHSHIYEFGTRQRRTNQGWNRGVMPEHPVTVPIAQRRRARMMRRLADMLRRRGFEVADA